MPGLTDLMGQSGQYAPTGSGQWRQRGRKPKRKRTGRPTRNSQVVGPGRDPSGGVQSDYQPNPYPRAAIQETPVVGQGAAPATAAAPKMSAYERRRKGILDIMNDPQLSTYNESYVPNYDIARSQIENAFAQAMGEVQSRQAAGQGLLGAMPGQIEQNYGGAAQTIDTLAANNAAAQESSGLKGFGNEGAELAPVKAGLASEKAGALTSVPTLGVGLNNLVSEQRQQLGTDRGSALADLSQREEEVRAAAEEARQERENAEREYAQHQLIDAELSDEDAKAKKKKDHYEWGTDTISGSRGEYVANKLPRLTARLRSGAGPKDGQGAYDFVRGEINKLAGLGPNKQKRRMSKILADARKKYPGAMKAISLAVYEVLGA